MKAILFLAALMPLGVLAQPININNNPNQPGYVVPSQQRMQNEMKVQQQQQQSMLKQDLNNQTRSQQQHLQNQLQTNQQRAAQGGNLNPPQQVLPNQQRWNAAADQPVKVSRRKSVLRVEIRPDDVNGIGADAIYPQRSSSAARWGLLTVYTRICRPACFRLATRAASNSL